MIRKVMLVDDVPTANFIMKKMIGKISPEYIIFLDLNMPVIDGWKFLDLMKEKNFKIKVYILSSSNSEFDINRSKQYSNLSGFLLKPLGLSALTDLLNFS